MPLHFGSHKFYHSFAFSFVTFSFPRSLPTDLERLAKFGLASDDTALCGRRNAFWVDKGALWIHDGGRGFEKV